jgi:predicted nucleotidyltransferase
MERTRDEWMAVAREGARRLYRHGARRVWLFGSLARGRRLDARSDLDFAVEGLPPAKYLPALGELLQTLPCDVDLVEWERAPEGLRQNVERARILLANEDLPA